MLAFAFSDIITLPQRLQCPALWITLFPYSSL